MENLLVAKDLPLATVATTDDLDQIKDGQIGVYDSNGKLVTAATLFKRNETFNFVLGNSDPQLLGVPGSILQGIVINPMDFKYACTPYVAPIKLKKTIIVNLPTPTQFDAATQNMNGCCMHPYRYRDVIVKLWTNNWTLAGGLTAVKPFTGIAQIGFDLDIAGICKKIADQLQKQVAKHGFTVTVANGNEITVEAPYNMYFNLTGDGFEMVRDSQVVTVTPMTFDVGGFDLTREQEMWDAVRDGYNPRFERSLQVGGYNWTQLWKTLPAGQYDTIVIETKTEYQYELLTNDNKGLWKKQFIVAPKGSAIITAITALLDGIGAKNKRLSDPAEVLN